MTYSGVGGGGCSYTLFFKTSIFVDISCFVACIGGYLNSIEKNVRVNKEKLTLQWTEMLTIH